MPRKYPTPDPPRPPPPHPHDRSPADQPARSAPDGTHDGDTHPETTQQQITSNRCPSGVANGSLRQLHFPTSEGILTFTTPSQRAPKPRIWVRAEAAASGVQSSNVRKPNLVMGANVQVCWEKFCRYWDVEPRTVPMEGEVFHLEPVGAIAACDENTIGVVAILGSTFDGSYEPVAEIAAALDNLTAGGR